jgi:hypothetical protein
VTGSGRSILIVLSIILALAATCGGDSRRLADGRWYGKVVGVDVARRAFAFAPACHLDRSGRWTAVRDRSRDPIKAPIARDAALEIYFRPAGNPAAGHQQSVALAPLADTAFHGRLPDSPPGWFVTVRDEAVVSVEEDSGIRSSDKAGQANVRVRLESQHAGLREQLGS